MGSNLSLDFLNMIRPQNQECSTTITRTDKSKITSTKEPLIKTPAIEESEIKVNPLKTKASSMIAVIDTETNWRDEVMSLGIALGDEKSFRCTDKRYYIFDRESRIGGMYSSVMHMKGTEEHFGSRKQAIADIREYLADNNVSRVFAYNARFDYNHLPELAGYEWYDIMRIAAYKQFNRAIPDSCPTCKTGRLKSNYGVEYILRLLSGNCRYCEVHNAVCDAVDELRIVELLGLELETYECARIN